jgi:GTP-binding protein
MPPSTTTAPSSTGASLAQAWGHTARFLITAAQLDQLPQPLSLGGVELHEVAFVGRSNAGKSTAINTLAQQKRLAFASKTPGRTQHINLFALGPKDAPDALWADLPGYGYAAVERAAKLRWQQVMADYLVTRRSLAGVVLLADSRLGLTELDLQLLEWIAPRVRTGQVKLLCLLTKADKLSRKEAANSLAATQVELAETLALTDGGADAEDGTEQPNDQAENHADIGVCLFSALSRAGVSDVIEALHGWAHPSPAVDPARVTP